MFANRFTALVDACALAGALKRNLLLTLAEAEFYRLRWSAPILDETEEAIRRILDAKGTLDAAERATRARQAMETAFQEAEVSGFEAFLPACAGLPDPKDAHVVAAAIHTRAAVIVTDNLKDFPENVLTALALDARTPDAFLADTIALDIGRAVAAICQMRQRLKKPEKTAKLLLVDMEAAGLIEVADLLRPHIASL